MDLLNTIKLLCNGGEVQLKERREGRFEALERDRRKKMKKS